MPSRLHRRDQRPFVSEGAVFLARIQTRAAIITAHCIETVVQHSQSDSSPLHVHFGNQSPGIAFHVISLDSVEACCIVKPCKVDVNKFRKKVIKNWAENLNWKNSIAKLIVQILDYWNFELLPTSHSINSILNSSHSNSSSVVSHWRHHFPAPDFWVQDLK